jgi:hypothetical protein
MIFSVYSEKCLVSTIKLLSTSSFPLYLINLFIYVLYDAT